MLTGRNGAAFRSAGRTGSRSARACCASRSVGPAGEYRLRACCQGREAAEIGGLAPDLGGSYEHWPLRC
jgi:hypothetical protein